MAIHERNRNVAVPDGGRGESQNLLPAPSLARIYQDPCVVLNAELALARHGLLDELEQSGILSPVVNPNPYDPVMEDEAHDQWWAEHQGQAEQFSKAIQGRDQQLRLIYVGMLLSARDEDGG